ncbi:hypothetical protein L1887_59147 [Cichorium endivia]|nr:hypothetical protein L1887_59147 [Cichorium endivia]
MLHGSGWDAQKTISRSASSDCSGFCTVVNRMSRGAQQDDPYSDWWMIQLEEKIHDSKEALKTIEDRLDTAMASLPPAISISENLSIQPVSLPLYIANPLGFQAVYLLTNYDEIVRAHFAGPARLFGLAQIYKYSGAARDDFAANNAKAEAARKMLMVMGQTSSEDGVLQQTAFRPLQQDALPTTATGCLTKRPFKAFKGKGELSQFADLCRVQESELKALAQEVLSQARRYPFTLVPVRLTEQNTQAGTQFLRWQQVTDRRMGRRCLGRHDGFIQNTRNHAAGLVRNGTAAHHAEHANEPDALNCQTGRRLRRKNGPGRGRVHRSTAEAHQSKRNIHNLGEYSCPHPYKAGKAISAPPRNSKSSPTATRTHGGSCGSTSTSTTRFRTVKAGMKIVGGSGRTSSGGTKMLNTTRTCFRRACA